MASRRLCNENNLKSLLESCRYDGTSGNVARDGLKRLQERVWRRQQLEPTLIPAQALRELAMGMKGGSKAEKWLLHRFPSLGGVAAFIAWTPMDPVPKMPKLKRNMAKARSFDDSSDDDDDEDDDGYGTMKERSGDSSAEQKTSTEG